jgi:iron(III) transport system permease protein
LPELRPAILGGGLLVFLYTLSEFGAVQLLGYDTLTRVIYSSRLSDRALSFASASVLLVLALAVVVAERRFRGHTSIDRRATAVGTRRPTELGWRKVPATLTCAGVAAIGIAVPVASLAVWARRGLIADRVSLGDLVDPAITTATVAVITAVVTVLVVIPVALATTRHPGKGANVAASSIIGGFAIPGLVIALSLAVLALNTPALGFLYQTLPLLIIAYVVHFGSQTLASAEQSVRAVPDAVREQSQLLEPNAFRRAWRVDVPLMRPGLLAGAGLVMLATVKELPATLLLAPNDFSTLATEVWSGLEEGFYAATGLASLTLIVVSGALTWLLVLRRIDSTS